MSIGSPCEVVKKKNKNSGEFGVVDVEIVVIVLCAVDRVCDIMLHANRRSVRDVVLHVILACIRTSCWHRGLSPLFLPKMATHTMGMEY
jgi:hypothetical protein